MAGLTLLIVLLVAFAQLLWLPLLHLLHWLLAPHGGLALLLTVGLVSWLLLGDGDVAGQDVVGQAVHNPAVNDQWI